MREKSLFSQKNITHYLLTAEASLAEVNFPAKAFYLFSAVGICASSSEARRQIKGGAARLEGEKITDPNQEFASAAELEGKVLQLGKKTFRRLVA